MGAAEQTKEVVELAVGYTKQIVEALTPIAKQAYEIGLVTIQVDAAAEIITAFLIFALTGFVSYKFFKSERKADTEKQQWCFTQAQAEERRRGEGKPPQNPEYSTIYLTNPKDWRWRCPMDGANEFKVGIAIACAVVCIASLVILCKVWLWVKLFSPDLWLAHQAVEKLLK